MPPAQHIETPAPAGAYLVRALVVWLGIAAAEVVHGILRSIFLLPLVGDLLSRQIGVATGSVIILAIAYLSLRWIGARGIRQLLSVGLLWMVLMAAFEITVGRLLGLSWDRIASDYLPWQGGFMLAGMTILALSPLLAAALRSRLQSARLVSRGGAE